MSIRSRQEINMPNWKVNFSSKMLLVQTWIPFEQFSKNLWATFSSWKFPKRTSWASAAVNRAKTVQATSKSFFQTCWTCRVKSPSKTLSSWKTCRARRHSRWRRMRRRSRRGSPSIRSSRASISSIKRQSGSIPRSPVSIKKSSDSISASRRSTTTRSWPRLRWGTAALTYSRSTSRARRQALKTSRKS